MGKGLEKRQGNDTLGVLTDRLLVVGENSIGGIALCKRVHHVAGLPREQGAIHGGVFEVAVGVLVMCAHHATWSQQPVIHGCSQPQYG